MKCSLVPRTEWDHSAFDDTDRSPNGWAARVSDRYREAPRMVNALRKRRVSDLKAVQASQKRRVKAIIEEADKIAHELGKPGSRFCQ